MTTAEKSAPIPRAVERVGRNAAILAGASILFRIGSLAVMPFVLRAFSTADYGLYSAAFAYAGLLSMIVYFGMNPIVVRDISRSENPRGWVIFHCGALRLILLLPAAVALVLIGSLKGFSRQMWLLTWLAFAVIACDALTATVKASMQAQGRFFQVAGVDSVRKSAQWLMAIVVIAAGASIIWLAFGVVVAGILAFVAAWGMGVARSDFREVSFDPAYARRMLRLAAPLGISAAFVVALDNIDVWMLDWLGTKSDIAVYSAANIFKPVFLAQAVVWAFMPLAFRLAREGPEGLAASGAAAGRFLLISGTAIGVLFCCGARDIVPLLAGEKYAQSIPVFMAMGVSLPFIFTGFLYLHLLTAVDRQLYAAGIFAAGLVANVLADRLLIPELGPLGAMIGTLATEVLIAFGALFFVWRFVGAPFKSGGGRTLLALSAGVCVAIFTQSAGIADMGVGALLVMVALLVVLRAVTKEDLALLKKLIVR